jgi:hypothetical protein
LGNSIVSGLSTKQTEKQAERKGNEAFEKAKAAGMTDSQASKVATDEMLSMLPPDKRRQLLIDNDGKRLSINFAGENGKVDRNQGGLSMSLAGDDFRSRHASLVDFISDEGLWGNNQMLGLATGLLDKRAAYYSYDSIAERGQQAFDEGYNRGFVNSVRPGVRAQQQQQLQTARALTPKLDGTYFFGGAGMDGGYIGDMQYALGKAGVKDVHIADRNEYSNGILVDFVIGGSLKRTADNNYQPSLLNRGDGAGQLNLIGYSYGSLAAAQTAYKYSRQGMAVDNLVLIGSPISSTFMDDLKKIPNIKNITVVDLGFAGDEIHAGDTFINNITAIPSLADQMLLQPLGSGHFYYAGYNEVGSERRLQLAHELFKQGLK